MCVVSVQPSALEPPSFTSSLVGHQTRLSGVFDEYVQPNSSSLALVVAVLIPVQQEVLLPVRRIKRARPGATSHPGLPKGRCIWIRPSFVTLSGSSSVSAEITDPFTGGIVSFPGFTVSQRKSLCSHRVSSHGSLGHVSLRQDIHLTPGSQH